MARSHATSHPAVAAIARSALPILGRLVTSATTPHATNAAPSSANLYQPGTFSTSPTASPMSDSNVDHRQSQGATRSKRGEGREAIVVLASGTRTGSGVL